MTSKSGLLPAKIADTSRRINKSAPFTSRSSKSAPSTSRSSKAAPLTSRTSKAVPLTSRRSFHLSQAVSKDNAAVEYSKLRRRTDFVKPMVSSTKNEITKKPVVTNKSSLQVLKTAVSSKAVVLSRRGEHLKESGRRTSVVRSVFAGKKSPKRSATLTRKSLAPGQRTPRSILKKEPGGQEAPPVSTKKPLPVSENPGSHHVKFKNKVDDQIRMRDRLNAWLEAKGKSTTKVSNHRHHSCFNHEPSAEKKKDVLLDRTITSNLLAQQIKVLNNEAVKKELFTKSFKLDSELDKENTATQVSHPEHVDTNNSAEVQTVRKEALEACMPDQVMEDGHMISGSAEVSNQEIFARLQSLMTRCQEAVDAGCQLENILPNLDEIETSFPEVLTIATYYILKAQVLVSCPMKVLDVFCQAVQNNAQPSESIAAAMKNTFSNWLVPPTGDDRTRTVDEEVQTCQNSGKEGSEHPMDRSRSDKFCSTPKQSHKKRRPSGLGSTIKFSVGSAKPLLRETPVPYITPVRRSVRLSGRQRLSSSAGGPQLRREVNSVSDLTSPERKNVLFQNNPAISDI